MRYRFKGLLRETGKPVEGHVDAQGQASAPSGCSATTGSSARRCGRIRCPEAYTGSDDEVGSAIDSALDVSSTNVDVDEIARRYSGQSVRVIDRDKIRKRVMEVVTTAIKKSLPASTSEDTSARDETLERVEQAIKKVFGDNANLTSEVPAPPPPAPEPAAPAKRVVPTAATAAGAGVADDTPFAENKFQLISEALGRIERNVNVVVAAAKRGGIGGGGGGGGRGADHSSNVGRHVKTVRNPANDKVLLQIFETNVKMQKNVASKSEGGSAAE